MARFVDFARIFCAAGDGGSGCATFRREKFVPRGGPDGGDGGKGGDVVLVGDAQMTTLLDFKFKSQYRAPDGANGARKQCSGRGGVELTLAVPLGCVVTDAETGALLGDITRPGQRLVVARGGKGGWGNTHFVTPTNQAPRHFDTGEAGEQRSVILELKIIADVGLVGLPNAGKSTLLKTLTAAEPKVASYPFTTLHPNLGVLEFDYDTRIVLADLPGLIEGASQGAGLGDRFLRHIERTGFLLHLVTDEEGVFDGDDLIERIELVHNELRQYGHALAEKPSAIVLSQIDRALDADLLQEAREQLEARYGGPILTISALAEEGLEPLRALLRDIAEARRDVEEAGGERLETGGERRETGGGGLVEEAGGERLETGGGGLVDEGEEVDEEDEDGDDWEEDGGEGDEEEKDER